MKGPRISGPWLEYWGGNTNALFCPRLYTCQSSLFLPCGTMFPWKFVFPRHVAASLALDTRASNEARRYGGLGVHAINIRARALNRVLSNAFDDSPDDTWTHREDPIKIGWARSMESVGPRHAIMGSWPTITTVDRSSSNRMVCIFRAEILYKYQCILFFYLTLDRIVNELSDF